MSRFVIALALRAGVACLCASCMDTSTAALGLEEPHRPDLASDAGSPPGKRDAGGIATDAGGEPAQIGAAESDDDDDDDDHGPDSHDEVHVLADDGGDATRDADGPEATLDAGSVLPASVDAGVSDTSVGPRNDERDAAREDAKGPVNPLCVAEPWHCQ